MKFSIIIASSNRAHILPRLFNSIFVQQDGYDDFEVVFVDDCSNDNTAEIVNGWGDKIKYLKQPRRTERVMAFKRGFAEAQGDYIFYMGSDDLMFPHFLPYMAKWTEKLPNEKLFNFGWCTINHHNQRIVSHPGHIFPPFEHFDNGMVAAGSFLWHKSINDQIQLPDALNCYEFADKSGIVHSSGRPFSRFTLTLGNPWGDDYFIFYRLTRKNKSTHLGLFGVTVVVR